MVSLECLFCKHEFSHSLANAGEFKPSWASGNVSSIPSFTPSFAMGMNPNGMQQPAQSSVRTLGKSKPITLSSLGAGKIGYNGSKSLSTSTPAAPAPAPAAPATSSPVAPATPSTPEPVETPKTQEKKEETPIETVESLDTPEEMVEDTTPSVVRDFMIGDDL